MKRCLLVVVLIFAHNVMSKEQSPPKDEVSIQKIIRDLAVPQFRDVRAQPRLLAVFVMRAHYVPGQPARPRAHL